jgi:monodictyphenone polyketide synthase
VCSNSELLIPDDSYFEQRPQEFTFGKHAAYITVQGYARLAGSAILVSPTLGDVPLAGAEAVRIAIRMGTVMDEVSQGLEPRDPESTPESWAAYIPDVDEATVQQELDAFNASTVRSTRSSHEATYR